MPRWIAKTIKERFDEKWQPNIITNCWTWTAFIRPEGYGHMRVGKDVILAHRLAYELYVGPVPDGLTLDHLCRNRRCVNPAHLEPVTGSENTKRGIKYLSTLTSCKRGHPFDEANTHMYNGSRICKTCAYEKVKRRRLAARSGIPAVKNTDKSMCRKGHPYDEANTYLYNGHRICKTCRRENQRRRFTGT